MKNPLLSKIKDPELHKYIGRAFRGGHSTWGGRITYYSHRKAAARRFNMGFRLSRTQEK